MSISKATLNIPVTGWHVDERRSIPLGHVGENVVQRINFCFTTLDTTVTYRLDFQQKDFKAWFALSVDSENNRLYLNVPDSMLTNSGSATLQIVAVGSEEDDEIPVAKTNRFSAKIFSAIDADDEITVDEVSEFEQLLAAYNEDLQTAITAATTATTAADNAETSADTAEHYAEVAQQTADVKGFIWFDITEDGVLQMSSSNADDLDFNLTDNGYLEVTYS